MGWGWGIGEPWDGDVLYRGNRETNPGRCIPPGPYVRYIQGTIIFQKPLHYVILHSGHLPVLPYFKSQKDWIQRAMQTPLSSSIRRGILQVAYYHSKKYCASYYDQDAAGHIPAEAAERPQSNLITLQ